MKVAYCPGCVSRGFTPELHGSMAKVAPLLDIELVELDRAACCGAGVIAEHDQELADTLNARTFALAQKEIANGASGEQLIEAVTADAISENLYTSGQPDPDLVIRTSGEQRTSPLIYAPYGDSFTIVASRGGTDEPPAWYLNLSENPEVEVQIKGDRFQAQARTASAEEKPELWRKMVAEWPSYDEYQQRTEREIPVVVLERA